MLISAAMGRACVGLERISKCSSHQLRHHQLTHKAPGADVITRATEETASLPQPAFSTEHVRGHQDKKTPFGKLPRMAQLNALVDRLATVALNKQLQRSKMGAKTFFPLLSCPVCLRQVNGCTIASRECLHMKNCIPESDMDTC
jgi:hypothetical protein